MQLKKISIQYTQRGSSPIGYKGSSPIRCKGSSPQSTIRGKVLIIEGFLVGTQLLKAQLDEGKSGSTSLKYFVYGTVLIQYLQFT